MRLAALLFAALCLAGCPEKTITNGTTTVTQIDSGESMRLILNYTRERSKLEAKAADQNATATQRDDAMRQLNAMDSAMGFAVQTFASTLTTQNKLVFQTDAQGRTIVWLEPRRQAPVAPGMVSP